MGATMKLGTGKEVELATNQPVKVSIYHKAEADGKGYITVCMNDVRVMETAIDNAAVGDYGLWLDAGMDAWFGNSLVTEGCTVVEAPSGGDQEQDTGDDVPKTGDPYMVIAAIVCSVSLVCLVSVKFSKKEMI